MYNIIASTNRNNNLHLLQKIYGFISKLIDTSITRPAGMLEKRKVIGFNIASLMKNNFHYCAISSRVSFEEEIDMISLNLSKGLQLSNPNLKWK